MSLPQRKQVHLEDTDSWLMSYADMVTLLLCFFVIFVSASEPKKDKMSEITEGVMGKFGTVNLATPFQGMFRSLQEVAEQHQALRDMAIEKGEKVLSMEMSSLAFFKNRSADFKEDKLPLLEDMVNALNSIKFMDYMVAIEGHTSDVPISNDLYPSNWELSSARAAHMARFFIEHGIIASRLRVVGYADTHPKVPNLDTRGNAIIANRQLNDRVVIRIEQVTK